MNRSEAYGVARPEGVVPTPDGEVALFDQFNSGSTWSASSSGPPLFSKQVGAVAAKRRRSRPTSCADPTRRWPCQFLGFLAIVGSLRTVQLPQAEPNTQMELIAALRFLLRTMSPEWQASRKLATLTAALETAIKSRWETKKDLKPFAPSPFVSYCPGQESNLHSGEGTRS